MNKRGFLIAMCVTILVSLSGCETAESKLDAEQITYAFTKDVSKTEQTSFVRAFNTWNKAINNRFIFSEVKETDKHSVLISKMDMDPTTLGLQWPGNICVNSKYQYHSGTPFGYDAVLMIIDLDGLALHEVGHFFGLKHSELPNVMYKSLHNQSHYLHDGDIEAIRKIYNVK